MLGGLGVGLAVILMVVAWQLSSGPISLAFLTPYIENAINAGQPNFKLTLKDTILTWAGWLRQKGGTGSPFGVNHPVHVGIVKAKTQ